MIDTYKINIEGLKLHGRHGAFTEEQILGQVFILDLSLTCFAQDLTRNDDLTKVLDYGAVVARVQSVFDAEPVKLLETLGQMILESLADFGRIQRAELTLKKPSAPVPAFFDSLGITMAMDYTK